MAGVTALKFNHPTLEEGHTAESRKRERLRYRLIPSWACDEVLHSHWKGKTKRLEDFFNIGNCGILYHSICEREKGNAITASNVLWLREVSHLQWKANRGAVIHCD